MDVKDHELLTRELRRREAYLAHAQRLSQTGSFGLNPLTGEIVWSDEIFRIFEFAPSSKVSLPMILERVHPQDMPSVKMAIAAATRGEGIDLEHRLLMPDGRIKYLHVVGKSESGETGSIEVIGAVMDITERKAAEEAIRRSEAYLVEAQRISHTGSFGCNASSGEMFWSEETFRIYGYDHCTTPAVEAILQRVHPEDKARVEAHIVRATSEERKRAEERLQQENAALREEISKASMFEEIVGTSPALQAVVNTERFKPSSLQTGKESAHLLFLRFRSK